MTTKMFHWCVASNSYNLDGFLERIWPLLVVPRMRLVFVAILHLARQLVVYNAVVVENLSTAD